jgi:hypothetical protein
VWHNKLTTGPDDLYPFTGFHIDEHHPDNRPNQRIIKCMKSFGNNPAPEGAVKGLVGSGTPTTDGFKKYYTNKMAEYDLLQNYGTLDNFRDDWNNKTAAKNNGIAVPIIFDGIDELPPVHLKILWNQQGQIAIGGYTRLLRHFIDVTMLGAQTAAPTFSWESDGKIYVCEDPDMSKEHVHTCLEQAVAREMKHIRTIVSIHRFD